MEKYSEFYKPALRKTWNAIKVLSGPKYRQSWKLVLKSCGRSMKWRELAASRISLVMIKRRANTFFMIVLWKVPKGAGAFVTTIRRERKGRNTSQKIAQ